jgi:fimbrial chaperone protein
MSFGVVINVAPPEGRPVLRVVTTGIAVDKHGKRHPIITVEDQSNVHALMESAVLRMSAGDWSKTYQPGEFAQIMGIGLVQPGKRRKFTLPDELPNGAETVQASIEYVQR